MRHTLVILMFLIVFSGCVTEDDSVNEGIIAGDTLPYFSVTLNNGETVTTSSLRGKVVMIEFFNTSCPDCQVAFPAVNEVYEELKDNPEIAILAIAREEDAASISEYWQENDMTIPYSAQTDRAVYNLFATVGIPRTYIADKSGVVTFMFGDTDIPSADTLLKAINASF